MVLGINSQRAVCLLGTVLLLGCRTPVSPAGTSVKPGVTGQGTRPVQVPNGSGSGFLPTGNNLIANGGGNLTTPTGNGLIANGGGNITNASGNGLIANGGGNLSSEVGVSANRPSMPAIAGDGVSTLSGTLVAPDDLTVAQGDSSLAFALLVVGGAAIAQKPLSRAQVQVETLSGEPELGADGQPLRAATDAKGEFRIMVSDSAPRLVTASLRDATGAAIRYRGLFKPGKPGKLDAASYCVTASLLARSKAGLELNDALLEPLEAAIQALRPNLFAQGLPLWRDETAVVTYVRNKALTLPSLKDFLAAYGEATAPSSLRLSQR